MISMCILYSLRQNAAAQPRLPTSMDAEEPRLRCTISAQRRACRTGTAAVAAAGERRVGLEAAGLTTKDASALITARPSAFPERLRHF